MTKDMFDGFDHTQHEEEVTARWGADAYKAGDTWWRGQSAAEQAAWKAQVAQLSSDWIAAARNGQDPDGDAARALSARHVAWLTSFPGTPAHRGDAATTEAYVRGLAEMYVSDPRFAANYIAEDVPLGAEFVRNALVSYVESGALRQG